MIQRVPQKMTNTLNILNGLLKGCQKNDQLVIVFLAHCNLQKNFICFKFHVLPFPSPLALEVSVSEVDLAGI